MPIYYLLVREALRTDEVSKITRERLDDFLRSVKSNRDIAADDLVNAKFELLEFDKLSQQGTNDASNIKERVRILQEFFGLTIS